MKNRFFFAAATIALAFSILLSGTRAATPRGTNQEQDLQQTTAFGADEKTVNSALCQIVYQVDQIPVSHGYRYLFYGSGFFVNEEGYVLTAAHVLNQLEGGQPFVLFRTSSGARKFAEAKVVAIDTDHDVAILKATPNPFEGNGAITYLRLTTKNLTAGERVVAADFRPSLPRDAYTLDPVVEDRSSGGVIDFEFSQLEDATVETELFVFSHPVQPGQSGAPVISSDSHAVAGLVEGEWLRGAITALAAAKRTAATGEDDEVLAPGTAPIPSAVVPIHYAIALLQQKGISWHGVPEEASTLGPSESQGLVAEPLSLVPAAYPSQSFFGGEVLLDAQVGRDGTASDVRVLNGEPLFVDKALAAVSTWMFRAAQSEGQARDTRIAIAFEFPQPYVPPRASTVHHFDFADALNGSAAVPVTTVEPGYPYPSNAEGSVILYGTVSADGRLGGIKVVRGLEPLTDAAISAARQWQFAPAKRSGAPVPSAAVIVVTYRRPLVVSHKGE